MGDTISKSKAKLCEDIGFAHQLNVTRGFFATMTGLLCIFDANPITDSIVYVVKSVSSLVIHICDTLRLDFCRSATDDNDDLAVGDDVRTVDDNFDGVPVRIYRPYPESDTTPKPAIVYIHGAVVMGTVDVWDELIRMYAANMNATIVYVEYRLAPEHGFPAPLDDCMAVTRWVLRNAHHYQIDPDSISIQGDSAGAVIAAVITQTIAQEHQDDSRNPELKMLILMMPLLQGLDINLPSHNTNNGLFSGLLTKLFLAKFWVWYMGLDGDDYVTAILQGRHLPEEFRQSDRYQKIIGHDLLPDVFRTDIPTTNNKNINWTEHGQDNSTVEKLASYFLNPKFSPFMVENISPHHPHTLIITGGLDILRDDGVIYANRLRRAGVQVWWRHFVNGFHGCNAYWHGMIKVEIGHQIQKDTTDLVRAYLHEPNDRIYS
ncbi:neutral cholesterol ester hydrolase 1-like [Amphiura filiformis]|uniref:neutral cholesterol ester hydrolase 1-like n=1 Tax=Amphiura filiformis TaxID=82378 RepID=UPI003B228356